MNRIRDSTRLIVQLRKSPLYAVLIGLMTAPAFRMPYQTGTNSSQLGSSTLTDSPRPDAARQQPVGHPVRPRVDLAVAHPRAVGVPQVLAVGVALGGRAQDLRQHPGGRVLAGVPVAPLHHAASGSGPWPSRNARQSAGRFCWKLRDALLRLGSVDVVEGHQLHPVVGGGVERVGGRVERDLGQAQALGRAAQDLVHQRSTSASRSSGATTALTRPICRASSAEYWRVRKSTSRAFFSPTTAGISWQPHHSGARADLGPGLAEAAGGVGDREVGDHVQLVAAADAVAAHPAQDRLAVVADGAARRGPMMWPARFSRIVRVGSRTSPPTQKARSPAPGEHDHAHALVVGRCLEGLAAARPSSGRGRR